jgi:lysophospholipase L1-like esterase
MRRSAALLASALIVAVGVLYMCAPAAQAAAGQTRTLKFLPYGDSKTVGAGDETHQGGYRHVLAKLASTLSTRWVALPAIARVGWTVSQMRKTVNADLARRTDRPDAILINLGTNLTEKTSSSWVKSMLYIVDAMHRKWPKAQIFIAQVWRPWHSPTAILDNYWIPQVVSARSSFVHSGIDERTFLSSAGLLSDRVHPNHAGYVKTAKAWKKEIGRAHV